LSAEPVKNYKCLAVFSAYSTVYSTLTKNKHFNKDNYVCQTCLIAVPTLGQTDMAVRII